MGYVLITAARNESRLIDFTISSVLAQSIIPDQWVIVSDGSTDGTDEIVESYSRKHYFITLLRIDNGTERNFASQANALNHAVSAIKSCEYQFVGCLDADITLEPDYYQKIIEAFYHNPLLGVAGGFIYEKRNRGFVSRPYNSQQSVAGAIQMFRRQCFDQIKAFTPVPHGGLDTVAELKAKMFGFHVQSFPKLKVFHHRRTGGEGKFLQVSFKSGLMDYEVGYHPLYELFCCARRFQDGILLLCSLVRYIGFLSSYFTRRQRMVSLEMINYLRIQQKARMYSFVKAALLCRRFNKSAL